MSTERPTEKAWHWVNETSKWVYDTNYSIPVPPTVKITYKDASLPDNWYDIITAPFSVSCLADVYVPPVPPHVPERVIYNGTTTIAIFPDGKKIISRPDKGAVFDKETGLAMCIAKHVYGTRAKFLKAVNKANDQNKEMMR